ncbi:histidinol-phosphatase [Fictibacillus barbaricus]|uniref:Histidinol-phosphatase n=1 Tax=Fictibacillus barbaricus TaxID=182136 RepID=A0ABS2ZM96_9BACL|nr:histidinol-phosphatase [Fictibacillus barbaricus]MBN3547805.1 histidinol-phosphatase [Fictibacillus barbaricus]GGB51702.1 histidinol-phosphatase [Fictibacillus barbaricus]
MLTDYHSHLEKGTLTIDYLKKFTDTAKEKGIQEFGISEHAYHFYETKNIVSKRWMEERRYYKMDDYVNLFKLADQQGLDVRMSIEMDYTPGSHKEMESFIKSYPFDYVIGSVHWVEDFGIDLAEYRKEWDRRDLYETYRGYYDQIVTLAESNLFDIVGHLDLVKIFNYVPTDQEFLLEQYDRVTDALKNSKTCVEISSAGLRKPVGKLYPEPELLSLCYKKGIPIVLSSDAHEPHQVGENYEASVRFAKETGYTTLMTFQNGERKEVELG